MKQISKIIILMLVALLFAGTSALSKDDPFKDMSAQELNRLLKSGEPVFLLNPLANILFRQGHIPGSVNIRWDRMDGSPLLPADKNMMVVTYCMGTR